jgi:hypothetical protein
MAETLDGYARDPRLDSTFGQGGVQTIVIVDSFDDALPFPYAENVIELLKSAPGAAQVFYMPPPGNLPRGHCINFLYTNGNRDVTFQNVPGGTVEMNGSTDPFTIEASGKRDLIIISCNNDGWRIDLAAGGKQSNVTFDGTIVDVQISGGLGGQILQETIPANALRNNGEDLLAIKFSIQYANNGTFNVELSQGGNTDVVLTYSDAASHAGQGEILICTRDNTGGGIPFDCFTSGQLVLFGDQCVTNNGGNNWLDVSQPFDIRVYQTGAGNSSLYMFSYFIYKNL